MKPKLIGICGPSTSGKTTLCKSPPKKYKAKFIEVDNYLKDKKYIPMKGRYRNWELPKNTKFNLLLKNLKSLKRGRTTKIPVYDFEKGKVEKFKGIKPTKIVFVEGYYLFHDKRIRDIFDIKIYLNVSLKEILKRKVSLGEEEYEWTEKEYLEKIFKPAHKKYAIAQKKHADFVIDGTLPMKGIIKEINSIVI